MDAVTPETLARWMSCSLEAVSISGLRKEESGEVQNVSAKLQGCTALLMSSKK